MKNSIFLLLIVISFSGLSQSTEQVEEKTMFYIFDETWHPNKSHFKTDASPNYLEVSGNEAVICNRSRKESFFMEGEVQDFEQFIDKDQKTTRFFIRGKNRSLGKIISIEVIEKNSGEIIVHVFQKLGKYDKYFSAHNAKSDEKEAIKAYWDDQR